MADGDVQQELFDALKAVLTKSLYHDGLARGLRESIKALDSGKGLLCVLSDEVDEPAYKNTVKALALEYGVKLITVPSKENLGEWAGLSITTSTGDVKKTIKCGVVVVREYGEPSSELTWLLEYLKSN